MKEGLFTFVLIGMVSMLLWGGVALFWKPDVAAPWRQVAFDSAQAEQAEKKRQKKKTRNNKKQAAPEHSNEEYPALNSAPVVATIATSTTSAGTGLFSDDSEDQNTLENQQVKTDAHQFNVTITYNDPACLEKFGHSVSVKILFNSSTAALKSRSISELKAIVQIYHQCREQRIVISLPGQGLAGLQGGLLNATSDILAGKVRPSLRQRREDEVKYYLMHMRVAKDRIRLPDPL